MNTLNNMIQSHRITKDGLIGWAFADVAADKVIKSQFKSQSDAFSAAFDYVKKNNLKTNTAILADYSDHYVVESTY